MPTNLRARHQDSDELIGLALSPKAAFQNYAASIGSGALAFVSVPNVMLAFIAFTAATYIVSEAMDNRALNNGDVVIKTWKKPRWDV